MLDEPPPLLGSWNRLYAALLGFLALQIVIYAWVTAVYA